MPTNCQEPNTKTMLLKEVFKESFHFSLNIEVNDKKILREFSRKAIQNNNRRRFFAWQKLVNFMSFHELFKEGMYMAFKDFLFLKKRWEERKGYLFILISTLMWWDNIYYTFYFHLITWNKNFIMIFLSR